MGGHSGQATDVVIIGGGIIGCATAYYTARLGLTVTVVEQGEIGGGSSSRCDGNILAIDKEPGFDSQMCLVSQQLTAQLARELDSDVEYRAPGSILVCENEAEMAAARLWTERQCAAGLPCRMLDRGDLRDDSPHFADDLPGGLECASDSTVNPALLTYALARGAQRAGARLLPFTRVSGIRRSPAGDVTGVETDAGFLPARRVVNAAGVWAPAVGAMVGLDIPIRPRRGILLVSARTFPVSRRKVMEFGYLMSKFGGARQVDPETERYGVALVFEPTAAGNFLLGSSRQFVGHNTTPDLAVARVIARRGIRFYPVMQDIPCIRTYAGVRPWTPDHLPVVSAVPAVPGFYIAAGHEGDGISHSAVTGKLMSQLLSGAPATVIPADPLRWERFRPAEAPPPAGNNPH